ncbi:hypothetical protein EYF80_024945 [Liparis tanakae]|uniref:Uncharacterized protein n=1 Tax=Liparis tanakae TaxID=230148 RepID=A0A4Z2HIU3_9TELE|nr:hypothetical protein EYF80_024945 [Liparis tanakae]
MCTYHRKVGFGLSVFQEETLDRGLIHKEGQEKESPAVMWWCERDRTPPSSSASPMTYNLLKTQEQSPPKCDDSTLCLTTARSSRPVATSRLKESQAVARDQPKDTSTWARFSGDTTRWNSSMASPQRCVAAMLAILTFAIVAEETAVAGLQAVLAIEVYQGDQRVHSPGNVAIHGDLSI